MESESKTVDHAANLAKDLAVLIIRWRAGAKLRECETHSENARNYPLLRGKLEGGAAALRTAADELERLVKRSSDLAAQSKTLSPAAQEFLVRVEEGAQRLRATTDHLLDSLTPAERAILEKRFKG